MTSHLVVYSLLLGTLLSGCGRVRAVETANGATMDTLAGGGVHVRNPIKGVWDVSPGQRWRLAEEFRLGRIDGEGPDLFGSVGAITEDALGRVWIADTSVNEIRVFDQEGRYIRSVGGRGQGPGEFSRLAAVQVGPDGNIWANDGVGRKWEVFDTSGARIAGHLGNAEINPDLTTGAAILASAEGHPLEVIRFVEMRPGLNPSQAARKASYAVRKLGPDGEWIPGDPILAPVLPEPEMVRFRREGQTSSISLPLAHHATFILGNTRDFWVTDGGGAYLIRRQSFTGDTLLVVERLYEPVPVSETTLRKALEALRPPEGMTSDDNDPRRISTVHPPFNAFHVSPEGYLWVRRDLEDDTLGFDVFDPRGIYLGEVETSANVSRLRIVHIGRERLYGVESDDLGVQYVVFFRIMRG